MTTYTPNYGLHKPQGPNAVSPLAMNASMDILDTQVKTIATSKVVPGRQISVQSSDLYIESDLVPVQYSAAPVVSLLAGQKYFIDATIIASSGVDATAYIIVGLVASAGGCYFQVAHIHPQDIQTAWDKTRDVPRLRVRGPKNVTAGSDIDTTAGCTTIPSSYKMVGTVTPTVNTNLWLTVYKTDIYDPNILFRRSSYIKAVPLV